MSSNGRTSFTELLELYRETLYDRILPFWRNHIDDEYGGVFNVMDERNEIVSQDKYIWSQARALWTFSALYNDEGGDRYWLGAASKLASFLLDYGRDGSGAWNYQLDRKGEVLAGPQSVYVDAFAMYGLSEYYRATGDKNALDAAIETFERTRPLLADHSRLPTSPHPIPAGAQSHGPSMMFALCYHDLAAVSGRTDILNTAVELAKIVVNRHIDEDANVLREFVAPGGGWLSGDVGSTFIPGHAIESMWFMERIFRSVGDVETIDRCVEVIRWHLERGWDDELGGIFLARHLEGGEAVWHSPDSKVWWSHTEALYALLRAYEISGAEWCIDWYWKVHNYTFKVFPDLEHGEWHQNLDRSGRVIPVVVKGLSVKDPFHLPRALIYSRKILKRLASSER